MNNGGVRREARAGPQRSATASDGSENTAAVLDELACTHYERVHVRAFLRGSGAFVQLRYHCGASYRGVAAGRQATQAFRSEKKFLAFSDNIPHSSECEDGRKAERLSAVREAAARMVKYYSPPCVAESETILSWPGPPKRGGSS